MPRLEFIIIAIFFISFILWAMRKCSQNRDIYQEENPVTTEETVTPADSIITPEIFDKPKQLTPANPSSVDIRSADQPPSRSVREKYTPLYVTLENLNIREQPALNAKVLDRVQLYDEVTFLNEVTDSIYEIKLGNVMTQAPWVKVKSPKGKVGWVYGAGVHYYKKRLEGLE